MLNINIKPLYSFIIMVALISLATPLDIKWSLNKQTVDAYYTDISEGSFQKQVALIGLGLYSLLLIIFNKKHKFGISRPGWLVIAFLCWAIISVLWTDDIGLSLKRLSILCILTMSALAAADQFTNYGLMRFAFLACSLTIALGFIAELSQGVFEPFNQEYRFSGVCHPNMMGQFCAVLIISSISLYFNKKGKVRSYLLFAIIGVGFLLLTKSRTSIGVLLLALLFYIPLLSLRAKKLALVAGFISIMFFLSLPLFEKVNYSEFFMKFLSMGRGADVEQYYPETLIARRDIWNDTFAFIRDRPITGYGYGAFWTKQRLVEITLRQGWAFGTAHSDYLDMILNIGFVGAFFYCGILLLSLTSSFSHYRINKNVVHSFNCAMILWFIINGFITSMGISPEIPIFIFLVTIAKLAFVQNPSYKYV